MQFICVVLFVFCTSTLVTMVLKFCIPSLPVQIEVELYLYSIFFFSISKFSWRFSFGEWIHNHLWTACSCADASRFLYSSFQILFKELLYTCYWKFWKRNFSNGIFWIFVISLQSNVHFCRFRIDICTILQFFILMQSGNLHLWLLVYSRREIDLFHASFIESI